MRYLRYISTRICMIFLITCLVGLLGCGEERHPKRAISGYETPVSNSHSDGARLVTVEHDGHLFVVLVNERIGGLVNHPSCQHIDCKKVAPK